MADINIQRKSSNVIWWVIGVIAALVIIWMLWAWMGRDPVRAVGLTLDVAPQAVLLTAPDLAVGPLSA
jgi:hypothetical protein